MIHSHELPQKSVFKSDEVCEIVGIKPYILRFWESEFTEISSITSSSGKKLFEQKDIILVSIIKELLFEKKLTLEKAKLEVSQLDLDQILAVDEIDHEEVVEEEIVEEHVEVIPEQDILQRPIFNPEHLDEIKSVLNKVIDRCSDIQDIHQWR